MLWKESFMRKTSQSGFTLIELIVVIVILGVLAGIALPKFGNMQAQARIAKMQGAMGAMKSASALSHALLVANNYASSYSGNPAASTTTGTVDINVEGIDVVYEVGYPTAGTIAPLAGIGNTVVTTAGSIGDYYLVSVTGGVLTLAPDANHTSCAITYTQATTSSVTPVFSDAGLTVGNCE